MRKGFGIAVAAGTALALVAALADHDGVRQYVRGHVAPAQAAYVLLEQDPVSGTTFERAAGLIQRARQRDAHAPWVYIALAKATLVYGYQQGSRYRAESFLPESVDRARGFSNRALELGPEESFAWAFRGRIAIMDGQARDAEGWLDRAQRLDGDSFYPRFYKSILHRQAGELELANRHLDDARLRLERDHQGRWILEAQREIAAARDDLERTEALHRRAIERFPASAEARADYGDFLLGQERYDEAVVQLERSLEMAPFPPVRRRLEDARALAQK